jgi:choline dehydrogenase
MVYLRGDPEDYEHWGHVLNAPEQWGYESMLPHFRKAETHPLYDPYSKTPVHGGNGPIMVAPLNHPWHSPQDGDASHPITRLFVSVSQSLGFPLNLDFARGGTEGVGINDVNACAGKRCNAAAYLKMCGAYPRCEDGDEVTSPNKSLTVKLSTHVLRVVMDNTPKAVGIEVLDNKGKKRRIQASKGVCLCAGAVNTPQILMLSGIGPQSHLEDVDVECVVNLDGVGKNLRDHLHVPMCYRIESGVKPHSRSNICEGSLFTKLNPDAVSPDLQVHCGVLFFDPSVFTPLGEGFTLTPSLIHPKSMGTVRLRTNDPFDRPVIEANYLTDENGEDLRTLVNGVKLVREIGLEMLDSVEGGGEEVYPGPSVQSDEDIEKYVIDHVGTMYHPACTCRVGRNDDPSAVLDLRLHVRGVENLRVADASAMPEIVGANTNATCIALGERLASYIVEENRNTSS